MFLSRASSSCYDALLTLVYPQACVLCNGSVESRGLGNACESCWQRTQLFSATQVLCWKCGVAALELVPPDNREDVRCHRCDEDAYSAARACGPYAGALRASVLQLKREPQLSRQLLEHLVRTSNGAPLNTATLIVPVPLHAEREKTRGFNQASIISRALSRVLLLPVNDASLIRVRHVQMHRAGMDAKGRRDTVAAAFQVVQRPLIEGERVLLVDDVFTTGATVSACAQALKDAGASEVFVLTIARAL